MTSKLHILWEDMKIRKLKIWEQTEVHVVIKKTMQNIALYSATVKCLIHHIKNVQFKTQQKVLLWDCHFNFQLFM